MWAIGLFLILLIATSLVIYKFYNYVFRPNISTEERHCELFVYPDFQLPDIIEALHLQNCLVDKYSLEWTARRMEFNDASVKPGRYLLSNGLNNREIIHRLRSGRQDGINLIVPAARDLTYIAQRAGQTLMPDSSDFSNYFFGPELIRDFKMDSTQLKNIIIPNTYQMWWNSEPKALVSRLLREYDTFWDQNDRRQKAQNLGLSEEQVIVLASIVERESNYQPERPSIAGVYLNRLKSSWPLQADPTVVFALGDSNIRRVLTRDLEIDSPYNTYKYSGLPPGPICIPTINSIDAVLNPEDHDFYYFCAKADESGTHVFSKSLREHMRNARKFQNWMNQERILR